MWSEKYRGMTHAPQRDGSDTARSTFERNIESNPHSAALIIEAYAYGARDRDIAALLTEELVAEKSRPEAERKISYQDTYVNKNTITGRLMVIGNAAKESVVGGDATETKEARYRTYARHLQYLHSGARDALLIARSAVRERVRTYVREQYPAGFWLADPDARKYTYALITHGATASPEKIALALTTAGIKLSKKQLESRMGSTESSRRAFADELLRSPEVITFSESETEEYAKRANIALGTIESTKRERMAEKLDFMQHSQARALVAGLLGIQVADTVSLHGRAVRHVVPFKTIAKLVTESYPTVTVNDITLTSLVRGAEGASVVEQRRVTVARMEQGQDIDIITAGKRRALELWHAYAARMQERTFLQSPLFRNTEACALAHVLLKETKLPLQGIASVLEERYEMGITKSLIQLLVLEEGTRLSAAQKILHYKNDGGAVLTDEVLARARALLPEMQTRYIALRDRAIHDVTTRRHMQQLENEIFGTEEVGESTGGGEIELTDSSSQSTHDALAEAPEVFSEADLKEQDRLGAELCARIKSGQQMDGLYYAFTDARSSAGLGVAELQISFDAANELGSREKRSSMQQLQRYFVRATADIRAGKENIFSELMRVRDVQKIRVRAFSATRSTGVLGEAVDMNIRSVLCEATIGATGSTSERVILDVIDAQRDEAHTQDADTSVEAPEAMISTEPPASEALTESNALTLTEAEVAEMVRTKTGIRSDTGRLTARLEGTQPVMRNALILTFTYTQDKPSDVVLAQLERDEALLLRLAETLKDENTPNPLRTYLEGKGIQIIEIRKMQRRLTPGGGRESGPYMPQSLIRVAFGDLER